MRRINLLQRDNDGEFDEVLSRRQGLIKYTEWQQVPEDSMEFHKVPPSSIRFHQVPEDSMEFQQVPPSSIRFHGVPDDSTNWPQAKRIQPYKASAPYRWN